MGGSDPPKTYQNNFMHHDFAQFRKHIKTNFKQDFRHV